MHVKDHIMYFYDSKFLDAKKETGIIEYIIIKSFLMKKMYPLKIRGSKKHRYFKDI